jgi:hypothetical protein
VRRHAWFDRGVCSWPITTRSGRPTNSAAWVGLWNARLPLYRLLNRGGHSREDDEQTWALATELHHEPGDGLTREMVIDTLRPLGFEVRLYPHNHRVGAEVCVSKTARAPFRLRFTQRLSGINPNSPEACMSLMCVATRKSRVN